MQAIDWLSIIHPFLAVTVIYPLMGVVARLGLQTRQRRVEKAKLPPSTGRDHSNLGQWPTVAVLVIVLAVVIVSKGLSGTRDLLEIPLHWQQQSLSQCNWNEATCAAQPR